MSDIQVNLLEGIAKFSYSGEGEISGESYTGVFSVKGSLSPIDSIKADRRYRELIGSHLSYASEHASRLSFTLSQLEQRIISSPSWWQNSEINGGHLDENVVLGVFDLAVESEQQFRQERKERSDAQKKMLNTQLTDGTLEKEV